jgi:hypothetical protein
MSVRSSKEIGDDDTESQRLKINCVPQWTQNAARSRRAAACWVSLHGWARILAFTTPPHCGQWPTGADARR